MAGPFSLSPFRASTTPWPRASAPARSRACWASKPGSDAHLHRRLRDRPQCLQLRRRRPGGIFDGRPHVAAVVHRQDQRSRARRSPTRRYSRGPLPVLDRHGAGNPGRPPADGPFQIESTPGKGTTIWLKKLLPAPHPRLERPKISPSWRPRSPGKAPDAFQELQHQNQELLASLEEIRDRQDELTRVNANWKTPTAAWWRCTPSWMKRPTICAAPTS